MFLINHTLNAQKLYDKSINEKGKIKPLSQCYNSGDYMCFRSDGEIRAISYSEWKDTFGKIIFCADTSASP